VDRQSRPAKVIDGKRRYQDHPSKCSKILTVIQNLDTSNSIYPAINPALSRLVIWPTNRILRESLYYAGNLTLIFGKSTVVGKAPTTMRMLTSQNDLPRQTDLQPQAELRTLLLTQKSELIAEIAQAMANQFNNLMMAVTSSAELELKKASAKDRHGLEQILTHATRATSLMQKLLSFSRKHASAPQCFDLNSAISEVSSLLKELVGEQTELILKLDADAEICADRIDVEQALFALVVIARNAMNGNGKLTISTSTKDLNQEFIGSSDDAAPGKYLALSLEHAGAKSGSSPHRDPADNVTLSLSAVRGVVRSCHGLVRYSSQPEIGSSFQMFFPASTIRTAEDESQALPRVPATSRTILVVEDDDAVRLPAAEFLMMEGFKVLQARTGVEALNVVQQSRSALDILITDMAMPKMNGREVAAALLGQNPNLKVLYISGDPGRQADAEAANSPTHAVLRKPFRLNVLRDRIHDLMGE
jgi:CheY-like chemotaxis protein